MWDNATTMMVVEGIFVTLYMTLATTFMGYVLGLSLIHISEPTRRS